MDSEADEEDERSEFNSSEVDWGEEQEPSWSEEEENGHNSWNGDAESEFSTGEAYERDREHWDDETDSERAFYEEENNEETDSQISLEEAKSREENSWNHEAEAESCFGAVSEREEEDRPWCEIPYSNHEEETDSQYSREDCAEEKEVESEAGRDDFRDANLEEDEAYTEEDESLLEEPRYIHFSGHEQGPEAYLRWEEDMEYWMRSQNIPKEKKLSHALDTLVGGAQAWWINEEVHTSYHNPVINWGHLKQRMYKEFVQKSHNKSYIPKRLIFQTTPKCWMSTPKEAYSPKPMKTSPTDLKEKTETSSTIQANKKKPKLKPQAVAHKQSPSAKLEPYSELKQCKSSDFSKSKEVICYRCHKQGHFAATCPERHVVNNAPKVSKLSSPKQSNEINELSFEISSSRCSCLCQRFFLQV